MPPQILFIERCLNFLKNGGRLGIILPETFFHAPNSRYILNFIKKHNVLWVVDLPHNSFRPHNNAKTIVIILQKNSSQNDYINMAVAEEMGHDHNGLPIYRWDFQTRTVDKSKLWDDIPKIISEVKAEEQAKYTFSIKQDFPAEKNIYVPRYYWNERDKEIERIAAQENLEMVSMGELIKKGIIKSFDGHGSPPAEYKGRGDVPYVRVKDIVNWDIYINPTTLVPEHVYHDYVKKEKELKEQDILFVRRGSYRIGSVAMVSNFNRKVLLTREILVFRVLNQNNQYGLNPFYLLYQLSSYFVQLQKFNKVLIETTLPNIGDRWKNLRLGIHSDVALRKDITEKTKSIFLKKWSAFEEINNLRAELGDIIT